MTAPAAGHPPACYIGPRNAQPDHHPSFDETTVSIWLSAMLAFT